MNILSRLATTAGLILATAACSGAGENRPDGPLPPDASTTVEVTNRNWSDMVVYAVRAGTRHRLGTVTSMTTRQLRVPRGLASGGSGVLLVADPIGGREYFNTGRIMVGPGQQIQLTLENHLPLSNYSVWTR